MRMMTIKNNVTIEDTPYGMNGSVLRPVTGQHMSAVPHMLTKVIVMVLM